MKKCPYLISTTTTSTSSTASISTSSTRWSPPTGTAGGTGTTAGANAAAAAAAAELDLEMEERLARYSPFRSLQERYDALADCRGEVSTLLDQVRALIEEKERLAEEAAASGGNGTTSSLETTTPISSWTPSDWIPPPQGGIDTMNDMNDMYDSNDTNLLGVLFGGPPVSGRAGDSNKNTSSEEEEPEYNLHYYCFMMLVGSVILSFTVWIVRTDRSRFVAPFSHPFLTSRGAFHRHHPLSRPSARGVLSDCLKRILF